MLRFRPILLATLTLALGATLVADAQTAGHGAHGTEANAAAPHRRVDAALQEIDGVIANGRGAGLAFVADQNGYPGPAHVLELRTT
jgi:hypothetical protein